VKGEKDGTIGKNTQKGRKGKCEEQRGKAMGASPRNFQLNKKRRAGSISCNVEEAKRGLTRGVSRG